VIGAPLSSRVVVAVGVRVGVAVGGVPVAVGVAVGGVPVTVGVFVGVGVSVAVGECVGVGVSVVVGVFVGVGVLVVVKSDSVGSVTLLFSLLPQHTATPFFCIPQAWLWEALMDAKVAPVGGVACPNWL